MTVQELEELGVFEDPRSRSKLVALNKAERAAFNVSYPAESRELDWRA